MLGSGSSARETADFVGGRAHVFGLDIAVHDVQAMQVVDSAHDLDEASGCRCLWERSLKVARARGTLSVCELDPA